MRRFALELLLLPALGLWACGPHSDVNDNHNGGDAAGLFDAAVVPDAFESDPFVDDDGDGYTENQGDCDDNDMLTHPFAPELCGDGRDNNCNGAVDDQEPDEDGDGYGPCQGDCDDMDPAVSPAATEVADGVDNNCDGIIDADYDGDGFTVAAGDCDDDDPDVSPAAEEICWDGVDNDCDGSIDGQGVDADNDGWGPCEGDCDDTNGSIHPGAPEVPGDGIDNNCDYMVDVDIDGDGWTVANGDCDDNDWTVHPGAVENCSDGVDNNCNGLVDTQENADNDGDGVTVCDGDCDDYNPAMAPGYAEDPTDGIDNDCNGVVDDAPACDCAANNEAQAMDLCTPGVTLSYGGHASAHGYRVNNNFGAIGPRHGCGYFMVSSGLAWDTNPQGAAGLNVYNANPVSVTGCFACTIPSGGWPHDGPSGCCESATVNDVAFVHMAITVPLNAQGFSFDFIFLSSEYPEWVHSAYNDTFYAVVSSSALGQVQNVSFDSSGQPLTVNNGWFETPPSWTQSIVGTGYDTTGSASGWLTTSCPATPGETLNIWFWVHDEGDHILDSATIVDNWQWVLTPLSGPITIK